MTNQKTKQNERRVLRELKPAERRAVAGGPEEGTVKGTGNVN